MDEVEKPAVRRAVPAGPAGAAGAARVPGRCCWSTRSTGPTTSSRRSCSRCSRPTQVTHPRARHGHRRDAADRRPHLQPHPRGARRAQAPLPLPLDRPPGPRARDRDRPQPAPEVSEAACRAGRAAVQRLRDGTTCSSRRVSPRPSTGPARCTRSGAADLDVETAAATLGRSREVPRGRRPGPRRARPDPGPMTEPRRPHAADEILLGFARALRAAGVAGDRRPRAQPSSTRSPPSALDDESRRLLGRPGHAVRLTGRPRALRPGVRRLVRRSSARGTRPRRDATTRSPRPSLDDRARSRRATRSRPEDVVRAQASATEVLRHRDVADAQPRRAGRAGAPVRRAAPARRRAARRTGARPRGAARSTPAAPCASSCAGWGEPGPIALAAHGHPAAPGRPARRRLRAR